MSSIQSSNTLICLFVFFFIYLFCSLSFICSFFSVSFCPCIGSVTRFLSRFLVRSVGILFVCSFNTQFPRLFVCSVGWSVSRLLGRSVGRSVADSVCRFVSRSGGRFVGLSVGQFAVRSGDRSVGRAFRSSFLCSVIFQVFVRFFVPLHFPFEFIPFVFCCFVLSLFVCLTLSSERTMERTREAFLYVFCCSFVLSVLFLSMILSSVTIYLFLSASAFVVT